LSLLESARAVPGAGPWRCGPRGDRWPCWPPEAESACPCHPQTKCARRLQDAGAFGDSARWPNRLSHRPGSPEGPRGI